MGKKEKKITAETCKKSSEKLLQILIFVNKLSKIFEKIVIAFSFDNFHKHIFESVRAVRKF